MSLPKNCQYINNIESAYSRNYNSNISPQNGLGPYAAGETIIVNIPTGRNLVMSGADSLLKFSATVTNGATASDTVRLDKAGAHSFIQRVRVFHGSVLLSDIDNYNNYVGMLMALQQSSDSCKGKLSILAGLEQNLSTPGNGSASNTLYGSKLNGYTTAVAINGTTTATTFTIPIINLLSFSDKYIPLFALTGAPLRVEIQLVNAPAQAILSLQDIASMSINKVEYICNFMEISDAGMQIIQASLMGGPLKWVTQDYRNYSYTATVNTGTELSVPIPSKFNSLRSLFVSFRSKSSGAATFAALDSTHFNLASYTFRLGSRTVPTKAPESIAEYFGELVRAIGCVSDVNHEPNISLASYNINEPVASTEGAASMASAKSGAGFYVGLDLESYSNSGMEHTYQGYNSTTDDIFFLPKFGTLTGATNVRIDTYAYYDQVVIIENGFATVQY